MCYRVRQVSPLTATVRGTQGVPLQPCRDESLPLPCHIERSPRREESAFLHRNSRFLVATLLGMTALATALTAVSCRKNPAQTKAKAVESAEKYLAAGEFGKAIIEYKNALKMEPRSAELQYKLGQAYVANRQLHEAFLSSSKAIELGPDYVSARIAQGRLYLAANQPDEAMKNAQGVLAKNADNTDAQMLLADAYAG